MGVTAVGVSARDESLDGLPYGDARNPPRKVASTSTRNLLMDIRPARAASVSNATRSRYESGTSVRTNHSIVAAFIAAKANFHVHPHRLLGDTGKEKEREDVGNVLGSVLRRVMKIPIPQHIGVKSCKSLLASRMRGGRHGGDGEVQWKCGSSP
ncbi:hypothetical protein BC830DRAFT_1131302 [Chytriomyces sp. MP71]|nr:hypothetical protein BC830DRAFT_1131302 [Chytriomyces sp. MP71]